VPAVTLTPLLRARLVPAPSPTLERLHDPLLDDVATGGRLATARFATRWQDTDALRHLGGKRAAFPRSLGAALDDYNRRLGASERSLASVARLASGDAVCAIAGQQPTPLGGPLYAIHKIASAVGLARRYEARTGLGCVPVFWMHGEDSDFVEIRSATLADKDLVLRDVTLAPAAHRDGQLVGGIAAVSLAPVDAEALAHWAGLPFVDEVNRMLAAARGAGSDLGEAYAALVLALFAEQGLVVVDPRLKAFREAARGVIDRYLASAESFHEAARKGGDAVESIAGRRPLTEATLDSFVFAVEDGSRRKISAAEARQGGSAQSLSPNVALRPVVQDGVLPTVAMACGPGEVAYLAQLREVYEGLSVRPACAVPRFSATWLPRCAGELLEAAGDDPAGVVTETDAMIRRLAERGVPADAREALEGTRARALDGLDRFAQASARLDPSLPQLVASARGKIDYQFQRLSDGLVAKARHRLEREHPEWSRLRYYLMPGDKTQERRLSSLEPVVHRGRRVAAELCDLAESHAAALEQGRLEHLLLDL
jgi:uncharacterized protein YllA (UPF0747 family)